MSVAFRTRASQGSLVSFSLLRLLHCLLSKSSSVSLSAYTQIRSLATAKGLKLQTLFSQYKNPICQVHVVLPLKCEGKKITHQLIPA